MEDIIRELVVRKYGDDIVVNYIYPPRFLGITDPEEMGKHAMEDEDPEFREATKKGGIVIAGEHFGGASHPEHAPLTLKYAGTTAIVAEFFSRTFFRNAIAIGLPVIECRGIRCAVEIGDELELELASGIVRNISSGTELRGVALPDFLLKTMKQGGLMPYLKARYGS